MVTVRSDFRQDCPVGDLALKGTRFVQTLAAGAGMGQWVWLPGYLPTSAEAGRASMGAKQLAPS